jgi:hypothetical protein
MGVHWPTVSSGFSRMLVHRGAPGDTFTAKAVIKYVLAHPRNDQSLQVAFDGGNDWMAIRGLSSMISVQSNAVSFGVPMLLAPFML